jgi:hypothetical protein
MPGVSLFYDLSLLVYVCLCWSLLLIQSDNLCLLIGKLSLFTSRVMNKRYLLISVFIAFIPGWVCHWLLFNLALFIFKLCCFTMLIMLDTFLALRGSSISLVSLIFFLTSHVRDCFSSFSVWIILLSIFHNTGSVDINHVSLSFSWKVCISPLRLKDSFDGYTILSWQLFYLRAWIILLSAFLDFRVCAKCSEVIIICLHLCVSRSFSLDAFSIIFLFSSFGIYIMVWCGVLFWSFLFGVWNASCTWVCI